MAPNVETGANPLRIRENLWLCRVQGDDALAEYLKLILPGKGLLDLVFSSRLYRYFVAAAPGLKELMAIGKIWYERQQRQDSGGPRWDVIVVDAGASGHSLQYLQMPATAARTFRSGLVHRESEKIATMMSDPDVTVVHVVATAEEMPLAEAKEILVRLRGELQLAVGEVFVNRSRESAPPGTAEAVARLLRPGRTSSDAAILRAVAVTASRSLSWAALQETNLARFVAEVGVEPVRVPLLSTPQFDVVAIERLGERLRGEDQASEEPDPR